MTETDRLTGAAARGDLAGVRALLERGVAPDVRDERGWPALMVAARRGHLDVVRALVAAGADVDAFGPAVGILVEAALETHWMRPLQERLEELAARGGGVDPVAEDLEALARLARRAG